MSLGGAVGVRALGSVIYHDTVLSQVPLSHTATLRHGPSCGRMLLFFLSVALPRPCGRPPPLCRAWHKAEQGRAEGAKARVTARAPCGAVLAHVTGLPSHQQPASPPEATSLFSVGALPPPSLPSSIPPPPSPARHIASMAVRGGGMGKTSTRDRRLRGGRGGGNERSGRQVLEAIHCAKPRPWVRQRVCSSAGRRRGGQPTAAAAYVGNGALYIQLGLCRRRPHAWPYRPSA